MLKKILINGTEIPVPVPIRNLTQAIEWVETTLQKSGQVLTRISINGKSDDDIATLIAKGGKITFEPTSSLEMQLESPRDLVIQSLETIYNLTRIVQSTIKQVAVSAWQCSGREIPDGLGGVGEYLELVVALMEQVSGLMDFSHIDLIALHGQALLLSNHLAVLATAKSNSDWKKVARILLHRIEGTLKDLALEAEGLHVRVLSHPTLDHPGEPVVLLRGK